MSQEAFKDLIAAAVLFGIIYIILLVL